MKAFILSLILAGTAATAMAQSAVELWQEDRSRIFDAAEIDLADFVWVARPVVVFAQTPNDPQFGQQMDLLTAPLTNWPCAMSL
tara:strand:+ start:309 stop:560 length:252 start_codon:yes stop_codon:yes gene_type:complete